MSGPIVHKQTMQKMVGVSRVHMPVFWTVGGYLDNIEADRIGSSHGANLKATPKNYGLLDSHVIPTVTELINDLKEERKHYAKLIRRICHYCEDSFTIGQICGNEFWGSNDNKFDIAGEAVRGKKNLHNNDISYADSYAKIVTRHKDIMDIVVSRYYKDAKKWGRFVSPREVTAMTRVAVVNGANLAAAWVFYAWNEAERPQVRREFGIRDFKNKFMDRTPKDTKSSTFDLE